MIEKTIVCLGAMFVITMILFCYRLLISVMYDWTGYDWDNDETD